MKRPMVNLYTALNTYADHATQWNLQINMKFIHYSKEHIETWRPCTYLQSDDYKPSGLWVSCESSEADDRDWAAWCLAEGHSLERLRYTYEVRLVDDANVLHLDTPEKMVAFQAEFATFIGFSRNIAGHIRWQAVAECYQGILIAPYFYMFRLDPKFHWYYPWDAASGCIWDLDAIDAFKFYEKVIHDDMAKMW